MQQKQTTRSRGSKQARPQQKTFSVTIEGNKLDLTNDQVLASGQGWKRNHGEFNGKKVESLSTKPIGNKIFISGGDSGQPGKKALVGYDIAELACAMSELQRLIDASSAKTIGSANG